MLPYLNDRVSVAWRDRPFSGNVHKAALPQGLTCAEIVAAVPNLDTRRFLEIGTVCVNGEVVPREMWAYVRPKSRKDVIVTLHTPIYGGGGGKDTLRIVAVIALLVIASAITGGAAAGLGASIGLDLAAGTIGAQVLAGAVTLGGSLLLGAFVKPPASQIEDDDASPDEGKAAALTGNQLKRGGSIPRIVGTHRAFPPFLSQPLIDIDGYDEVIEGVYGFAGPHKMRDFKFGDIFFDDIDLEQMEYEFYELSDDDTGIDENVKLLAQLNGAQDSVAFIDSSDYGRNLIASDDSGVFIDRRAGYVATAAAYFLGSAHISVQTSPAFLLSSRPWSIDFFCEWDGAATTIGFLFGHTDASQTAAGSSFVISKTAAGLVEATVYDGTTATTLTSTASIESGRHHIAFARIDNILYLWIDGRVQTSAAFTGEIPPCASSLDIAARGNGTTTTRWFGWINNLRFSVNRAWYEAGVNFTPPEIHYKREEPSLITRHGKTSQPQIRLSEHRIADEQPDQTSRDLLANQSVPQRSLPLAQSVAVRGRGFDQVWITLGFAGLAYTDEGFDPDDFNGIPFRIRVRELGDLSEDAWVNLPEIHIHDKRSVQFSRMLTFRWDTTTSMPDGLPTLPPPARKGWRAAYYSVPVQGVDPVGIGGWTANAHFYDGSGDTYFVGGAEPNTGADPEDENNLATTGLRNVRLTTERAEFFLDGLIPQGPIEVEIRRGQIYIADKFNYGTYNLDVGTPADDLVNGIYDFFGWADTNDSEHVVILKRSNALDEVVLSRVSTVWGDTPPIANEGEFAAIYMRVTGRSLSALSTLASGLVPDWDGSGWTGKHATSNPAPHYRDVLVGSLNDNRIPEELVNDETLVEWRKRCADLGFECNAVFNGEHVDRVLEVVSSCGYARPRQSETWDVAQDRDFSSITPAQMFTPRNMRNFRWDKAFIRHRPDGLRVRYSDQSDDYVERTLVVPRAGVSTAVGGRLEEIRYDGITTELQAVLKALYDQQQVIDRFTFYSGDVDAEMLVCRRGDLVLVQHDIVDHFAGFSRVLRVDQDNGIVENLHLDGSVVPVDAFFTTPTVFFETPTEFFTSDIGVVLRLKTGGMISFEAELSEDGFTLTPRTTVYTDGLERECLVTTGRLTRANRRMIVYNIKPRNDFEAQLTFVDEAPQLWPFPEPLEVGEEFMRNRLINGSMSLAQRGLAVAVAANSAVYTLDRWYTALSNNGGAATVSRASDTPASGFDKYLQVDVDNAVSPIAGHHALGQIIQKADIHGFDWGRSGAKQAALSFNVRSSIAGTYYGSLVYIAGGSTVSYVFTYTIPVANEWFRRIVTVPAPLGVESDDDLATLRIEFSLGGSDDETLTPNEWVSGDFRRGQTDNGVMITIGATLAITGAQLEPIPATQFEWLPTGVQDELARRYFQKQLADSDPIVIGTGVCISTTQARIVVPLATPLRTVPTVEYSAVDDLQLRVDGAAIDATVVALDSPLGSEAHSVALLVTVAAGLTAGQAATLQLAAAGYVSFDSEMDPG